jgi:RHS repeat-associated protein
VFCEERGRDDVGRIASERWVLPESVGSTDIELAYAYEPATRRLSSVDVEGEPGWTYGYDANGVRDSWVQLTGADADGQWPLFAAAAITFTDVVVDGADRLWSHGDLEFDWDEDGRLKERRRVAGIGSGQPDEVTCYVYDAMGALRTVARHSVTGSTRGVCATISSAPAWQVDYDTDHQGRRTRRAATGEATYRFLYGDSLNPVALLDNVGRTLQRYVYLPGAHTPSAMLTYDPTNGARLARWLFVNDSRGSVRLVVNAETGAVGQRIDYGPWGEVIDDTAPGFQPFGYAGGEYDHLTGLTRFGARDYDPTLGRWTARDPIAFEGGDTNLYAYVGGDPVNGVDVTGLEVYHCQYNMGGSFDADGKVSGWFGGFNHHMMCTDTYASLIPGRQSGCVGFGPGQNGYMEADRRRGSAGVSCRTMPDINEACANTQMGQNHGSYFPLVNDCFDAVERIINQCDSSIFRWTDGWEFPFIPLWW